MREVTRRRTADTTKFLMSTCNNSYVPERSWRERTVRKIEAAGVCLGGLNPGARAHAEFGGRPATMCAAALLLEELDARFTRWTVFASAA